MPCEKKPCGGSQSAEAHSPRVAASEGRVDCPAAADVTGVIGAADVSGADLGPGDVLPRPANGRGPRARGDTAPAGAPAGLGLARIRLSAAHPGATPARRGRQSQARAAADARRAAERSPPAAVCRHDGLPAWLSTVSQPRTAPAGERARSAVDRRFALSAGAPGVWLPGRESGRP